MWNAPCYLSNCKTVKPQIAAWGVCWAVAFASADITSDAADPQNIVRYVRLRNLYYAVFGFVAHIGAGRKELCAARCCLGA